MTENRSPVERAVEVLTGVINQAHGRSADPQKSRQQAEIASQALADAGLLRDHFPDSEILLSSLVQPHRDLYSRNAAFHHGMNTFVAMLPAMVRGLAADAVEAQHEIDQRKSLLEQMPMPKSLRRILPDVCQIPACGCNGEAHEL